MSLLLTLPPSPFLTPINTTSHSTRFTRRSGDKPPSFEQKEEEPKAEGKGADEPEKDENKIGFGTAGTIATNTNKAVERASSAVAEKEKEGEKEKRNSATARDIAPARKGPVRPSRSSQLGGRRRDAKINLLGEELWTKINEPRSGEGRSNAVNVAVRVRPLNRRELDLKSDVCVQMSDTSIALVEPTSKEKTTFTFDYAFDTMDPSRENFADQEVVFKRLGLDVLRNAWEGYNACLFAYGQTGAGKSWR